MAVILCFWGAFLAVHRRGLFPLPGGSGLAPSCFACFSRVRIVKIVEKVLAPLNWLFGSIGHFVGHFPLCRSSGDAMCLTFALPWGFLDTKMPKSAKCHSVFIWASVRFYFCVTLKFYVAQPVFSKNVPFYDYTYCLRKVIRRLGLWPKTSFCLFQHTHLSLRFWCDEQRLRLGGAWC